MPPFTAATPFWISIPQTRIDAIRARVATFDWADFPDAGGWRAGIAVAELRRICAYWVDGYDWHAQEEKLNRLPHFMAEVEGLPIHFIHLKGSNPDGRPPVLLTHGWPGSFLEFLDAAERLAFPHRFGGQAEDGLDLVIPSLPGYGFSGRPAEPIGPRAIARLFNTLMTEVLHYPAYVAQGGDWGSVVSTWLAHDHAGSCVGLHLNMCMMHAAQAEARTDEEHVALAFNQRMQAVEGGYSHLQATRPQTLGFALADSPVGAAAWILEKFAVWSDLDTKDGAPVLESRYTIDQLLTNVMLYIATGRIVTSTWLYKATADLYPHLLEHPVLVPTAVAAFPDPIFPAPPRSYAEQSFAIRRWTPMARGGHFAAMEQPVAFAEDVRAFVLSLG